MDGWMGLLECIESCVCVEIDPERGRNKVKGRDPDRAGRDTDRLFSFSFF